MRCKDCIHCNICNKTESDIYGTYGVMGETVFLTEEAAEKALREREENV